jgi:NCAIR mutase (PurE)-related protein
MNKDLLIRLLHGVAKGNLGVGEAAEKLQHLACENIGYAHIDHHRSLRKGFPEVIFGEGKSSDQITGIMEKMSAQETLILVTRVDYAKAEPVLGRFPLAQYHPEARMIVWREAPPPVQGRGTILVIAAGTSDIPVAQEAFITAEAMGNHVEKIIDVGVAGIHRLLQYRALIERASVLIVIAGMEGALPSVVAGMVSRPVIAVPTSVGYGVSLGGLTPLFAMLSSCSSNVAVVNIDNGFGAGYVASLINRP